MLQRKGTQYCEHILSVTSLRKQCCEAGNEWKLITTFQIETPSSTKFPSFKWLILEDGGLVQDQGLVLILQSIWMSPFLTGNQV